MAEPADDSQTPGSGADTPEPGADEATSPTAAVRGALVSRWQGPALIGSAAFLTIAAGVAIATRPKPVLDPLLDRAEVMVHDARYEDAIRLLNSRVYPYLERPELSTDGRGRYHLLLARSIDRRQRELAIDVEANDQNIIAEYAKAAELGQALSPLDEYARASARLRLGEIGRAVEAADRLYAEAPDRAFALYRESVDAYLARREPARGEALSLLTSLLTSRPLSSDQRAWVLSRQSEVMLDRGEADAVITRLLRELPRLERSAAESSQGELSLRLAQAYMATRAFAEADAQLTRADRLLGDGDAGKATVHLLRARLFDLSGEPRDAAERYGLVVSRFSETPEYGPAMLGLAEARSALGELERSFEHYQNLISMIVRPDPLERPAPEEVKSSLVRRSAEHLSAGALDDALRFVTLGVDLYGSDRLPTDLLEQLAMVHSAKAESVLGPRPAGMVQDRSQVLSRLASVPPASQREAQRHLIRAGYFWREHAERFLIPDLDRYGQSLWDAADAFDTAGDLDEAVSAFRQFVRDLPAEARHAEARFRLAQALQARGEHAEAAQWYRSLISDAAGSDPGQAGPWADASRVPLSQALLADADPQNDAEAEGLLERVVRGEHGSTETPQFRAGLIELARQRYRSGEYDEAIERFTEALDRWPADPLRAEMLYGLGDSYRQSAKALGEKASSPVQTISENRRRELEAERERRLVLAASAFERAAEVIAATPPSRRTPLERTQLRNATFFAADCAFDRGDYTRAIEAYERAKDRYAEDPASLVALVQIVNAYVALGDFASARTANTRARLFFSRLPDSVWDDPELPMDRDAWERWLASSDALVAAGGQP